MAAFVAGLLGMSQQELCFRVQRANELMVAPFLSVFQSVSPLLGLSASSDDLPLVAAADETLSLPTSSQPAQLLEDADGEQNAQSDASALEPLSLNRDAKFEEGELQLTLCEQGLCGRWEALPHSRGERERESPSVCSEEGLAVGGEAFPQVEEEGDQLVGGEIAESSVTASIAQLDGGCLAKVLSYADNKTLRACSLVCREWLEVSSFVRTLMSLQEGPQITALPSLVARFSRLETLHIQGPEILPSWMLRSENPASGLPVTEQTAIVPLDDSALEIIARGCRRLNKLHLEWCCGISDAGLAAVLRGCSELADLSLEFCGAITGEAFSGLACRIEKLDLVACDAVKNEGLLAAGAACPGLKELRVSSNLNNVSLAEGLERAAKFCKGLQALFVHACGLKDETLRALAVRCPMLSSATISREPAITDGGLAAFLAALPELDSLSLQHMDGLSRVPRIGASKRLKKLRLGFWWDAPDLFLRGLSEETTLEELRLECCPQLTDATVDSIFAGCRSLRLLVLLDNKLITAESIRAYLRHGKKSMLQILECPGATKDNIPDDLRTALQDVFP